MRATRTLLGRTGTGREAWRPRIFARNLTAEGPLPKRLEAFPPGGQNPNSGSVPSINFRVLPCSQSAAVDCHCSSGRRPPHGIAIRLAPKISARLTDREITRTRTRSKISSPGTSASAESVYHFQSSCPPLHRMIDVQLGAVLTFLRSIQCHHHHCHHHHP